MSGVADPRAGRPREEIVILAAYVVLSAVFLWPLSARPGDTVAYVGDSLATVYFTAENGRRIWSDPFALFSAGIAHPLVVRANDQLN